LATALAIAPAAAQAQAERCEALAEWSPVRLPLARAEAAVPCSDAQLAAFAASHPPVPGAVGCMAEGRTFHVLYLVNLPAGFFDNFTKDEKDGSAFAVEGHRGFRFGGTSDEGLVATQIVEIDASRSVIMSIAAPQSADSASFSAIASCFLNSFEFTSS